MSITAYDNRRSYTGDGTSVAFPFQPPFTANADLVVILRAADGTETIQTLATNYTVTGAGLPGGGTVTFFAAPAVGITIVVYRDVLPTQTLNLLDGGPLPAATANGALDKLTMEVQRLRERADRGINLRETDTPGSGQLNAGGNRLTNIAAGVASSDAANVGQIAPFAGAASDSANAAAASATSSASSATNAAASAAVALAARQIWMGQWLTATAYVSGSSGSSAVQDNGSSYLCILGHISAAINEPGVGANWTTFWSLQAAKGSTGATGAPGATGATGPAGGGDFVGPTGATAGNLVSFSSATGKAGGDSGLSTTSVAAGIVPPGSGFDYLGSVLPTGYLWAFGQNVSRTTYTNLYNVFCPVAGAATFTSGSNVVNCAGYIPNQGDRIRLFTTGTMPGAFTANTDYYVYPSGTGNSFFLNPSAALGATAVIATSAGSGTITMQMFPHGAGDGSTTFGIPDKRGRVSIGADAMGGTAAARVTPSSAAAIYGAALGQSGGEQAHLLSQTEMPAHTHTMSYTSSNLAGGSGGSSVGGPSLQTTSSTGGGLTHNNMQPSLVTNYIIKT